MRRLRRHAVSVAPATVPAAPLQPRLTVGAAGDSYEREAERVAPAETRQRPVDRRQVVALASEIATRGSGNAVAASEMRQAITNGEPQRIDCSHDLAETYGSVTLNPLAGDALGRNHQRLRPAGEWLLVPGQPGPNGEPSAETRLATTEPELRVNEEAYDARGLLGVLNITPEQVKTESGQELIERQIAAAESI